MFAMPGPSTQKALPIAVTDSLGCRAEGLHQDQTLAGRNVQFYRKRSEGFHTSSVETPPSDRGFLIGISMLGGHNRRIVHEHHSTSHDFDAHSIYIRNFTDRYRADLEGSFDFLLMEFPTRFLATMLDEAGASAATNLICEPGHQDPALSHMMRALIPALDNPQDASPLFIDQLACAMTTYMLHRYGDRKTRVRPVRRSLTRAHETLAKELLASRLDGDLSVADVAEACSLSRSYFIRAFRETTGQTPHQWLVALRIEKAKSLLMATSTIPLVDIAIQCGFSDQSHFTRSFVSLVGTSPGHWRKQRL